MTSSPWIIQVEELITTLLRALDDNERLQTELRDAEIEISYLRGKVEGLADDSREAQRTGRREFIIRGVEFVAAVLTIPAAISQLTDSPSSSFAADCAQIIGAVRAEYPNAVTGAGSSNLGPLVSSGDGIAYPTTVQIKAHIPSPTVTTDYPATDAEGPR